MKTNEPIYKHFISEPISVQFENPPQATKHPHCPDRFIWHDEVFEVCECLAVWQDYSRRGRMAVNMQPQHARLASQRGSWGVGKFFFDIAVQNGKNYRIYYDRKPKNALQGQGQWILLAELSDYEDQN